MGLSVFGFGKSWRSFREFLFYLKVLQDKQIYIVHRQLRCGVIDVSYIQTAPCGVKDIGRSKILFTNLPL